MGPKYPGKILLIDDDQDTLDIYFELLTNEGFSVDTARDGEEGFIKISKGGYDLILLDIMMPKIDGISLLKRLKQRPPISYNGPIIVLSALDQDLIVQEALKLGAKGYIVKSDLNPDEVLKKVYQLVNSSKPDINQA